MKTLKTLALLAALSSPMGLSGCVVFWLDATSNTLSTDAIVISATGLYFGLPDSDIKVQNLDHGLRKIRFQAEVKGFLFNCKYSLALVTCDEGTPIVPTPAAPQ